AGWKIRGWGRSPSTLAAGCRFLPHPPQTRREFPMSDAAVLLRRIEALDAELAKIKAERDHFYTQFQSAWAALTPRSEEEKRGLERVLAILQAKLSDGGGIVGPSDVQRAHNDFYRGRRLAFEECSTMLRASLT